jgi:hypothetical protein
VTPHVAQNTSSRRSAIDAASWRRHQPAPAQAHRRDLGWVKTTVGLRETRHRGLAPIGWIFTLVITAHNLVRLPKLLEAAAC